MATHKILQVLIFATFIFCFVQAGRRDSKPKVKSEFFVKKISVNFKELRNGKLEIKAGPLTLRVQENRNHVEAVLTKGIRNEVLSQLQAEFYTGNVVGVSGCTVEIFVSEGSRQVSGNVDCTNQHFILETLNRNDTIYHTLRGKKGSDHRFKRPGNSNTVHESAQTEIKYCTLFIHTDPFLWRHMMLEEGSSTATRSNILQLMISHILAANRLNQNTYFQGTNHSHAGVQYILSGYQIDDDSQCGNHSLDSFEEGMIHPDDPEDEYYYYYYDDNTNGTVVNETTVTDYTEEYSDGLIDLDDYDDSEYEYYYVEDDYEYDDSEFINDYDYGDWDDTIDMDEILESLRNPFNTSDDQDYNGTEYGDYDDDYWFYGEGEYDDYHDALNNDSCYENINGTINPSTEFCKQFSLHDSALFLNMFSTVDHSAYCVAHIWTYRAMDVVGLADTPTDDFPRLSGYCSYYDEECEIALNAGLVTFWHQGSRLSLADSQETFLHELAHSMGSEHDPMGTSPCNPDDHAHGKYIMHPAPMGADNVRREFSACSRREVANTLETHGRLCLMTWGELMNSVETTVDNTTSTSSGSDNSTETASLSCDIEPVTRYMTKLKNKLQDLHSYIRDGNDDAPEKVADVIRETEMIIQQQTINAQWVGDIQKVLRDILGVLRVVHTDDLTRHLVKSIRQLVRNCYRELDDIPGQCKFDGQVDIIGGTTAHPYQDTTEPSQETDSSERCSKLQLKRQFIRLVKLCKDIRDYVNEADVRQQLARLITKAAKMMDNMDDLEGLDDSLRGKINQWLQVLRNSLHSSIGRDELSIYLHRKIQQTSRAVAVCVRRSESAEDVPDVY